MPDRPRDALSRVIALVKDRLGAENGDDLAIRLKWSQERGSNKCRRVRNWVDQGLPAPRQFADLLDMLGEAGLLQPEAEEAWRGVTRAEAARAVAEARDRALEAEARARSVPEEGARGGRSSASG